MTVPSRPSKAEPKEFSQVVRAFEERTIFDFSDDELRECLLGLGKARILSEENRARCKEMGETIRHILSERSHTRRQTELAKPSGAHWSRISVWVALAALVVAAIATFLMLEARFR